MKVLLFGASGHIGREIADELLSRGHTVTGVTRSGASDLAHPNFTSLAGDATDEDTVASLAPGHDAVATAVGPRIGKEDDRKIIVGATRALIDGVRRAGVRRLVALGGAGSLETAPGVVVLDSPHFPQMWKANAMAQSEALALYRQVEDLDWTFISPAQHIEPGDRVGTFRVGGDQLLVDAEGHSRISISDYAIAFVDELENSTSIRRRITVAY